MSDWLGVFSLSSKLPNSPDQIINAIKDQQATMKDKFILLLFLRNKKNEITPIKISAEKTKQVVNSVEPAIAVDINIVRTTEIAPIPTDAINGNIISDFVDSISKHT